MNPARKILPINGGDLMIANSNKNRLLCYVIMGLIIGFFMMPLLTVCFFECKYFVARNTASALLFFFR